MTAVTGRFAKSLAISIAFIVFGICINLVAFVFFLTTRVFIVLAVAYRGHQSHHDLARNQTWGKLRRPTTLLEDADKRPVIGDVSYKSTFGLYNVCDTFEPQQSNVTSSSWTWSMSVYQLKPTAIVKLFIPLWMDDHLKKSVPSKVKKQLTRCKNVNPPLTEIFLWSSRFRFRDNLDWLPWFISFLL